MNVPVGHFPFPILLPTILNQPFNELLNIGRPILDPRAFTSTYGNAANALPPESPDFVCAYAFR